jgi:hypothetical protein
VRKLDWDSEKVKDVIKSVLERKINFANACGELNVSEPTFRYGFYKYVLTNNLEGKNDWKIPPSARKLFNGGAKKRSLAAIRAVETRKRNQQLPVPVAKFSHRPEQVYDGVFVWNTGNIIRFPDGRIAEFNWLTKTKTIQEQ